MDDFGTITIKPTTKEHIDTEREYAEHGSRLPFNSKDYQRISYKLYNYLKNILIKRYTSEYASKGLIKFFNYIHRNNKDIKPLTVINPEDITIFIGEKWALSPNTIYNWIVFGTASIDELINWANTVEIIKDEPKVQPIENESKINPVTYTYIPESDFGGHQRCLGAHPATIRKGNQ